MRFQYAQMKTMQLKSEILLDSQQPKYEIMLTFCMFARQIKAGQRSLPNSSPFPFSFFSQPNNNTQTFFFS